MIEARRARRTGRLSRRKQPRQVDERQRGSMTVRSETRAEISGSASELWGYLADVSRWPEWAVGIVSCAISGDGELRSGSRLVQTARRPFGAPRSRTLDVTTVDAPRTLAFAGTMGAAPIRWGFEMTDSDAGRTHVLLWIEAEPRGAVRVLPPVVLRSMFRQVNQREVAAIKTRVESRTDS